MQKFAQNLEYICTFVLKHCFTIQLICYFFSCMQKFKLLLVPYLYRILWLQSDMYTNYSFNVVCIIQYGYEILQTLCEIIYCFKCNRRLIPDLNVQIQAWILHQLKISTNLEHTMAIQIYLISPLSFCHFSQDISLEMP